jgi:chemosensory pili system protein ChpC
MAVSSVLGSVLVPLHNKVLLVPNVSMAELIPFRKPVPMEKSPAWHLGALTWRGISIPLISFEVLNGEAANPDMSAVRIAVFNNVGTNPKLPFYGMLTQGIPRSLKIADTDIVKEKNKTGPAESAIVTIKGELVSIPNVDFIESAIVKAKIV